MDSPSLWYKLFANDGPSKALNCWVNREKEPTVSDSQPCDLCQLPIEVPGFELNTTSGPKRFCCEGCEGIYRMLHEDEIVSDVVLT